MKTLTKIFFVVLLFLGLWFGLTQIDFVKYFGIQNMSSKTEKTIGDLIWKEIERTEHIIYDNDITETLDSLLLPLCKKNGIDRNSLKIHIVRKDEVNAFAFPDR
ncbi:MAG TPA: hypothetical protein VLZ72_10670, partial [Flavobacterium sp.]|nr:hypothetical protein [Flavobacterium sp.]